MAKAHGSLFRPLHLAFYQNCFSIARCQFTIYYHARFVDYARFHEEALR